MAMTPVPNPTPPPPTVTPGCTSLAASTLAEVDYDRRRALVEVRLPDRVESARVTVECTDGAVLVDGVPTEGPVLVHVENGTALLAVTGRSVVSEVLSYTAEGYVEMEMETECTASRWSELDFGRSLLLHGVA